MSAYKLFRCWLLLFFGPLFRFKVKGREYIPRRGGFILAPNHTSYLDPVFAGMACPKELGFMAKEDLFKNFLFAIVIRASNTFPVKRTMHDRGAIAIAKYRVRRGSALLIFPEGTRSPGGELQTPQRGIAYLADATGAPVVPCYIKGTHEAWPVGAKKIKLVPISVYFGKPLRYKKEMNYREFARLVMHEIATLKAQAG
ncbi:MAG: lysophospholipid acyltransferase family protein [Candidatus Omnitrophota bacterium]